jgi:S-DNA-T family DNA segregation ATPase FtsK/SpoIIIE
MAIGRREKLCSILGILLICLSIILIISFNGGPEPLGKLNQHLRMRILPVMGDLAWIMPILGLYWAWTLIVGGSYGRGLLFSLFLGMAFTTLSTFSYLGSGDQAGVATNIGGRLGHHMGLNISDIFGGYGSRIIVTAGLLIVFIAMTGLSLRRGAIGLERGVREVVRFFRRLLTRPEPKPRPRVAKRTVGERPAVPRPVEGGIQEVIPLPIVTGEAERQKDETPSTRTVSEEASDYACPPISLFENARSEACASEDELQELASLLEDKLASFDISTKVVEIHPGPVITRFEIELGSSTKVHQVVNLADDLALALRARSIRILAPIPGKGTIGIEVPNRHPSMVRVKEILGSKAFVGSESRLALALGKDVAGNAYVADLEAMPHLLIAGATGSGKSVCINSIITSLVCKNSPQQVQILLIDPKRLELNMYDGIPHLVCEVVTEAKKAVRALSWVVEEMDLRYQILASRGVRNIQSYQEGLPYIVVIIDELADLMLIVPQEIEMAVTKLAQMARAVGIHLVVATQRPSVDVITGVIKANFPCRIAFKVASKIDSRTIIDVNGAERLLGKGDMLLLSPGSSEPIRVHGAFVSAPETQKLVEVLKKQSHLACPAFSLDSVEHRETPVSKRDELFEEAATIVITHQQGSVSLLQRRLKIGYSRAARLIDFLEEAGIVGPFEGSKARKVLVDESYLENLSRAG